MSYSEPVIPFAIGANSGKESSAITPFYSGHRGSGQNWIRTSEGVSQRIYSPPRLATSVSTLSRGVGGYTYPAISTQGFRAKISRFLTASRGARSSAPTARRPDLPRQESHSESFLSDFVGV